MTIATFGNRRETPLTFVVEPWGATAEIPHLGEAGVRYTLQEGAEDRSYSSVEKDRIEFWCNADSVEIDIVSPSAFDLLCNDICVHGGWCSGIVGEKPCTVDDLLPQVGQVTAGEFAEAVIRADSWNEPTPYREKHLRYLEEKFIEHMGASNVRAEALRRINSRPFGEAAS